MAIHLGRPLRVTPHATYPDGGPETAPRVAPLCRPYSVLLPVWFAVPPLLPGARWALTPPFHPCRDTYDRSRDHRGGLLSVALSLGSPPPDVIRHRVSMEPGLSSPAAFRLSRVRPPGRLARAIKAFVAGNATENRPAHFNAAWRATTS